ncbi:hypothetical protein U1Q18_028277 [Sarracenia purpurea var. burkii]
MDRAILSFFPTTQGCREDGLVDPDGKHRSLGIVDGGGFTRGSPSPPCLSRRWEALSFGLWFFGWPLLPQFCGLFQGISVGTLETVCSAPQSFGACVSDTLADEFVESQWPC